MSYTELYTVTKLGNCIPFADYKNAWLGAMLVWNNLYKRYCGEYIQKKAERIGELFENPYLQDDFREIWKLFHNKTVKPSHRIVLCSTFDRFILERERFKDFHGAVGEYAQDFENCGTYPVMAERILKLSKRASIIGVCWNHTSVNDMWHGRGSRRYNIHDGDHWFLYQEFEMLNANLTAPDANPDTP